MTIVIGSFYFIENLYFFVINLSILINKAIFEKVHYIVLKGRLGQNYKFYKLIYL